MLNDGLYPSSLLRKGLNGKSPEGKKEKKVKKGRIWCEIIRRQRMIRNKATERKILNKNIKR